MKLPVASITALLILCAASVSAQPIVFDFEDFFDLPGGGPTPPPPPDIIPPPPPLTIPTADLGSGAMNGIPHDGEILSYESTKQGLTLEIVRADNSEYLPNNVPFDIIEIDGNAMLSPFAFASIDDLFVARFSHNVTQVSIDFGDFGEDEDYFVYLQAFSDESGLVAYTTEPIWEDGNLEGTGLKTLTVMNEEEYGGIDYVIFAGGGEDTFGTEYPNSLYWDNLTVVPEPSIMGFLTSLILLGYLRLRRR